MGFFSRFGKKKQQDAPRSIPPKMGIPVVDEDDPIEPTMRGADQHWRSEEKQEIKLRSVNDFPIANFNIDDGLIAVGDSKLPKVIEGEVMDAAHCHNSGMTTMKGQYEAYSVPVQIAAWYYNQSFIGYQACAILAQHWLVDKACSQSIEDAVRNGWEYKSDAQDALTDEQKSIIDDMDIKFKVKDNLIELGRFTNIFGIRIWLFVIESDDPEYYKKPFNIDGIKQGSYKGISQIDPYWMTPLNTSENVNNPANKNFYEPDYWVINGKQYHRSHLIITRGPQPADVLKPTYIFGGIPLVQRIYERVYAAERTANEAPLLATNKRTAVIHVDTAKAAANEPKFLEKLLLWVKYRDNHAVKVLGKDEAYSESDTSLADFDAVIMNQYQLVAAIARTPATKLLGTSPKGFNATGEFESVSYHEELESIQERWLDAPLERHYMILMKSLGWDIGLNVIWNPVDSMSAEKRAEINSKKIADGKTLIESGVISPDEERNRIENDRFSGYNQLAKEEDANTEQGMSPENIAELEKAGAEKEKGAAEMEKGQAAETKVEQAPEGDAKPYEPLLEQLAERLQQVEVMLLTEGKDITTNTMGLSSGVKPGIDGMQHSVSGLRSIVPQVPEGKLPKMKMGGMVLCIENPRGSIRSGNSLDGAWQIKMPHHYGYVRDTFGADGDPVDVFVGPNTASQRVFVVNQKDIHTGDFDEHKAMLGFDTPEAAQEAYNMSYGTDWAGFDSMAEMSMGAFRHLVQSTSEEQPLTEPARGVEHGV